MYKTMLPILLLTLFQEAHCSEDTKLNKKEILEILTQSSKAKKDITAPKEKGVKNYKKDKPIIFPKLIIPNTNKSEKMREREEIQSGVILPKEKEFMPSSKEYKIMFRNLPKGKLPLSTKIEEDERRKRLMYKFEKTKVKKPTFNKRKPTKKIKIKKKIDPIKELY